MWSAVWSVLGRAFPCGVLIAFAMSGLCRNSQAAQPRAPKGQADIQRALEFYRAHDYTQARLELERSLKDHPDAPPVHELLGLVLDMQDEPDAARSHLEA